VGLTAPAAFLPVTIVLQVNLICVNQPKVFVAEDISYFYILITNLCALIVIYS